MATKYNKEDTLPIVLCVLNLVQQDLVNLVFMYAVEKHYPDLKGLLARDDLQLNMADCELLRTLNDDDVVLHVNDYVVAVEIVIDRFVTIYDLNIGEIFDDERITLMAEELYWSVVSFRELPEDLDDALYNLERYAEAVLGVVHYLCKLVSFEIIDVDCAFNDDIYNSFLIDLFNPLRDDSELNESILFELMLKINTYNEEYFDSYD